MSVQIYHNPRCSKSRQTLQLLIDQGHTPEIIEYLKTPPSAATIEQLLDMLGLQPRELMRQKEAEYKELDLANTTKSKADLIQAIAEQPRLLERPVVVKDGKAAIGRPPENVLQLL